MAMRRLRVLLLTSLDIPHSHKHWTNATKRKTIQSPNVIRDKRGLQQINNAVSPHRQQMVDDRLELLIFKRTTVKRVQCQHTYGAKLPEMSTNVSSAANLATVAKTWTTTNSYLAKFYWWWDILTSGQTSFINFAILLGPMDASNVSASLNLSRIWSCWVYLICKLSTSLVVYQLELSYLCPLIIRQYKENAFK